LIRLAAAYKTLDVINDRVGKAMAWLALAMVLTQFVVVVLRYVFSVGFIMMQESIWYLHGILFMLGAGYTLLRDGHVRVDIVYRTSSPRKKALIDLFGVVIFLIPVCLIIFFFSWPYVIHSWEVFEGSTETGGIPAVFLLKTVIPVFVILVLVQGVSMGLRSFLILIGVARPEDGNLERMGPS